MRRRLLLQLLALPALGLPWRAEAGVVSSTYRLAFPRDFGSHPEARTEWWYATGWLQAADAAGADAAPTHGFQVTFFRSRTGVAATHASQFAASQLVFAHAAVTELRRGRLRHDQRIARSGFGIAQAAEADTAVQLRDWQLQREASGAAASLYRARVHSNNGHFGFALTLVTTQPVLLQGEAGFSQKGPQPDQASHYYSQPQLAVSGSLLLDGQTQAVRGRAWLDHEWSDTLLDPQAVGWDWIGINLADGSALTAFRLRRADGSALFAGGSFRSVGGTARNFATDEVAFTPGRTWTSSQSRARYPVVWTVQTPAGRFGVAALLDDQELDSRNSTGSVYWEGLSELRDAQGRVVGHGYLEMTGYAAPLRL
jgi:predicted secreted hydrolase